MFYKVRALFGAPVFYAFLCKFPRFRSKLADAVFPFEFFTQIHHIAAPIGHKLARFYLQFRGTATSPPRLVEFSIFLEGTFWQGFAVRGRSC